MDPSDAELNGISNLTEAFDWAGVPPDVRTTLARALGTPTLIRDISFIPRADWDLVVSTLKGQGVPADAGDPPPERDLTLIDKARIESFRRVCFRRVGSVPDTPGATPVAAPAPAALAPAAIANTNSPSRKVKLSAVVDQTLDAEITSLTTAEVNAMYEQYRLRFGDVPSHDSEPTNDQLSAVRQLVQSGGVPYIDYAIFGPHGLRLLRKLTFSSFALNATGEWQRKEMPGPPSFEAWFEIHRVVRTTCLLLEVVTAERMDAYCEHIRSLHTRFGSGCWDLIYLADVHMRSEQFERLRRRLTAQPEHGFTTAAPWSAVYAQAIKEDAFWQREVVTPATLRLAQGASRSSAGDLGPPRALTEMDRTAPTHEPKKRKKGGDDDKSKHDGQKWTHNRKGVEICGKWNSGKCGVDKPQSKCLARPPRSHQCNSCLGPHAAKDCRQPR